MNADMALATPLAYHCHDIRQFLLLGGDGHGICGKLETKPDHSLVRHALCSAFLQAQLLESGMHALKMALCLRLGVYCATKVIYVIKDMQTLVGEDPDDQGCHILAAGCHPPQAEWKANVSVELIMNLDID